jgi:hypothetical protein
LGLRLGLDPEHVDEQLLVRCTGCPDDHVSEVLAGGALMNSPVFPPTGIADRLGQDLWEARFEHVASAAFGFLRDVCPVCAARPTVSADVGLDHELARICGNCGTTQALMATVRCETCTVAWRGPAWVAGLTHPDVIAFFHDRGLDAAGGLTLEAYRELLTSEQSVRATDPLIADVAVVVDGDELVVTIDDRLDVLDVTVP